MRFFLENVVARESIDQQVAIIVCHFAAFKINETTVNFR